MADLLKVILESPLNFLGTGALILLVTTCVIVIIQAVGRHIMGHEEN